MNTRIALFADLHYGKLVEFYKGSPLKPQEVANEFKKSNIDYNGIYIFLFWIFL